MDELGKFTLVQVFFIVIIPALISGIPALIAVLQQRYPKPKDKFDQREQDSSAADKIAAAYDKIVDDLQIRIDKMETRFEKLENDTSIREKAWITKYMKMEARLTRQRKRINYLEEGVQILIKQLESMGATPSFVIEEEKKGE